MKSNPDRPASAAPSRRPIVHTLLTGCMLLGLALVPGTAQVVDPTAIAGKHIVGYQGWFRVPGDGSGANDWSHWFGGNQTVTLANLRVDAWPDLTGYPSNEKFDSTWDTGSGSPAYLFSSFRQATVNYHLSLMQTNNIDCVAVQRFITQTRTTKDKTAADKRVTAVKAAAATYGRTFFIMYDVNGSGPGRTEAELIEELKQDWLYLTSTSQTFQVLGSTRYQNAHSKPLVIVYGMDNESPYTPAAMDTLRTWFLQQGVTMGVGVSWNWMNGSFATAIKNCGVVLPWSVGAFSTSTEGSYGGPDAYRNGQLRNNLVWAKDTANKTIIPVVWAGYSHKNASSTGQVLNSHPRWGGCTYWRQVYNTISEQIAQGEPRILYTAMFDEVNEGTAIMPQIAAKSDLPVPAKDNLVYLNIDGYTLPRDWYLKVAGQATNFVRSGTPTTVMPISPPSGATPPCCQ